MKQLIFFLMVFLIAIFSSFSQSKNDTTGTKQKIMQQERNIIKAFLAGDKTRIDQSFASDYKGYYNHTSENKEMLLKNVGPLTGITIKDMQMDARVYGTAAVVHVIGEIKAKDQKPVYRQFIDMFVQQKDGWKIVASQQSTITAWNVRALEDSELATVTGKSCEVETTLQSLNSDVPTFLRFKNNTAGNVTVYWINYSGQRDTSADQIHQIAAGKSFDAYTYFTHPFIVIGSNGKCNGIYEPATNAAMAVIKD